MNIFIIFEGYRHGKIQFFYKNGCKINHLNVIDEFMTYEAKIAEIVNQL